MSAIAEARRRLAQPGARIALVGASNDPRKYGNIILLDLRGRGYEVLPVNNRESVIGGSPAASTVAELQPPLSIINVVVPPNKALEVVRETDPSYCDLIWFQPGAYDAQVVSEAKTRFGHVLAGDCIMVVARQV